MCGHAISLGFLCGRSRLLEGRGWRTDGSPAGLFTAMASSTRLRFNPQAASITVKSAGAGVRLVAMCQGSGFLLAVCWRPPTIPCHTGFSALATYVIKPAAGRVSTASQPARWSHNVTWLWECHLTTLVTFYWLEASSRSCLHSRKGGCYTKASPSAGGDHGLGWGTLASVHSFPYKFYSQVF